MTRDIDAMIAETRKPFRFAFDEFHYAEGYPKLMVLDPGEAEILMHYYLKQRWGLYMQVEFGGCCFGGWERWMLFYSNSRLNDLVEAGLINQEMIEKWWDAHPVPCDVDDFEVPEDTAGCGVFGELDPPVEEENDVSDREETDDLPF